VREEIDTYIQDLSLLLVSTLQGNIYIPAALVVQNVCPNFADLFWGTEAIQVIVLDLEVLPDRDQYGECGGIGLIRIDPSISHTKGNG
jgi:hypothetical protein